MREAIDPKDYPAGTRVKVEFEGVVNCWDPDGDLWVEPAGSDRPNIIGRRVLPHITLTRLDPPLKVGDRVRCGNYIGEVVAMDGILVWMRAGGDNRIAHSSDLTLIPGEPK